MRKYMRKVRLSFGGGGGETEAGTGSLSVGIPQAGHEDLRIAFNIEAHIGGEQNTGSFDVWNLAEGNRNKVGREWTQVECEAGYTGSPAGGFTPTGVIFKGDIRDFEHIREGPEIRTHVECAEGDVAIRTGTIAEVVDGGPKKAVERLAQELGKFGVAQGDMPGLSEMAAEAKRPIVLFGSIASELDKLTRAFSSHWYIRSGVLEVISAVGAIEEVVLISPETGMVGVPTITDDGVKVTTQLDPHIQPGRLVRVQSSVWDMLGENGGLFRVDTAVYHGDNGQGPAPGEFFVSILGSNSGGGA